MRFLKAVYVLGVSALTGAAAAAGCGGGDGDATSSNAPGDTGGGQDRSCALTNPVCTAVTSDCIAVHDNQGSTKIGLRMGQLTITKPDVLAVGFVSRLVREGLTMNLPQCYLNGTGTFSWLLELDTAAGTLRTGGALPTDDPRKGYCFADMSVGDFEIAPTDIDATLADGAWSAEAEHLNVPIFLEGAAAPLILPLHKVRISETKLSADSNCIGRRNDDALDPQKLCAPDAEGNPPSFINGGKVSGFIKLEEVDKVIIPEAGNSSLCVVLSGDSEEYGTGERPNTCKRESEGGRILLRGDWCSETNSPATDDCADAYALGAEYAASAVKITGLCPQ